MKQCPSTEIACSSELEAVGTKEAFVFSKSNDVLAKCLSLRHVHHHFNVPAFLE